MLGIMWLGKDLTPFIFAILFNNFRLLCEYNFADTALSNLIQPMPWFPYIQTPSAIHK